MEMKEEQLLKKNPYSIDEEDLIAEEDVKININSCRVY